MNHTNLFFLWLVAIMLPFPSPAQKPQGHGQVTTTTVKFGNPDVPPHIAPCTGKGICNKLAETKVILSFGLLADSKTLSELTITFPCQQQKNCPVPDSAIYTFDAPSILIDTPYTDTFYMGNRNVGVTAFDYKYSNGMVTLTCINPGTILCEGCKNTKNRRRPEKK